MKQRTYAIIGMALMFISGMSYMAAEALPEYWLFAVTFFTGVFATIAGAHKE